MRATGSAGIGTGDGGGAGTSREDSLTEGVRRSSIGPGSGRVPTQPGRKLRTELVVGPLKLSADRQQSPGLTPLSQLRLEPTDSQQ